MIFSSGWLCVNVLLFCAAEYIYTSLLLLNKDHPNDLLTHMQRFTPLEPSVEISQCREHDDVDRLLIVFEFVYTRMINDEVRI